MPDDRKPTLQQQAAIDTRDRELLVSAAAGSGKTATLTRRVIASLLDGSTDLSRLLVVTFTRAAAREMRTRIAGALTEAMAAAPDNAFLAGQLAMLGGARISTIDSFYLDVVRGNAEAAGLSPAVRTVDTKELFALRRDAMNTVIDGMYRDFPDTFAALADVVGEARAQNKLTENLLDIYDKLRQLPGGLDTIEASLKEAEGMKTAPYESAAGKRFLAMARAYADRAEKLGGSTLALLEQAPENCRKKHGSVILSLYEHGRQLNKALAEKDAYAVCGVLSEPLPSKSGGKDNASPELAALLKEYSPFKKIWDDFAENFKHYDTAEIAKGAEATVALLTTLDETLRRFDASYKAAKAEREVAEFADVSAAVHRLLVAPDGSPTDVAKAMQSEFDAIYLDEFQDTDGRQDEIFRVLSNGKNRFMVGDIKQSIYRFRGADADVFNDYRQRQFVPLDKAAPGQAATIFLSDCFRCDRPVVDFSNAVSGFVFPRVAPEMGYEKQDDLVYGKKGLPEDYRAPECRLLLLTKQQGDDAVENPEARLITAEIVRLLREGKRADGDPLAPKDIAVFARNKKDLAPLAAALEAAGVPVNDATDKDPFENPEVLCVFSLLSVIDNPQKDVHLAAVLRSPFFGFSLSDLVSVRSAAKDASLSLYEAVRACADPAGDALAKKCAAFLSQLTVYRAKAQQLPVDKLLRFLYRDTLLYGFTKGETGQKDFARRANLNRFYEYARRFEAGGYRGLFQFIRYIEGVMESGLTVKEDHAAADAVTLSTIHGSKGLEYAVCFLTSADKTFRHNDLKNNWLIDKKTGFTCYVPCDGPFLLAETFSHAVAAADIVRDDLAEEARILYVAMTRAKERLIVTGTLTKDTADMASRIIGGGKDEVEIGTFGKLSDNYLTWILAALLHAESTSYCEVKIVDPASIPADCAATETVGQTGAAANAEQVQATLQERFGYVYPHAHLTRLPAKLSVSRLSPTVLDVYDGDGTNAAEEDAENLLRSFDKAPLFDAKKEPDAAARGTATHEFLQFCDFGRAEKEGVAAEIERLTKDGFLPDTAAEEVRQDELSAFFASAFYKDLRDAREVHRETRFNVFLPARDFTEDPAFKAAVGDETLLVQGVIDLFYTDKAGDLVLCDYKTDRLTPAQLKDPGAAAAFLFARHGEQLRYYKEALRKLCGRCPDRVLIYSLPLGEAVAENENG